MFFLSLWLFRGVYTRSSYDTCSPLLVWQRITPSEMYTWHRGTGGSSPRTALFIQQQKTSEVITLFIPKPLPKEKTKLPIYPEKCIICTLFSNNSVLIARNFSFYCIQQIESMCRMISLQTYLMGFCKEHKHTAPIPVVLSDVTNWN